MQTIFTSRRPTALQIVQLVVFLGVIAYFARGLIVPVLYGLLVAVVLYPLTKKLEQRGWPKSLAITLGLTIVLILFSAVVMLTFYQLNLLRKDIPILVKKLTPEISAMQHWMVVNLGIPVNFQNDLFQNAALTITNNAGGIIKTTLSETAATLVTLFLVPVFAALFLYNRHTFVMFLEHITGDENKGRLHRVLSEIVTTYYRFIKGTGSVYLIVGTLNSIGLLALGIDHAILFGMLTAIMTIVPYVGIVISALLPISVAWITKDSLWYPAGVIVVFAVVQYLEANIIFPRVVGTELKLSTWSTLLAIIAGGLLWGIAGMILFLPLVGILKIATDDLPAWRPLNMLLSRDIRV